MLRKNVAKITFDDLNALKEDEVPEGKRLEYKSQLPGFLFIPDQDKEAEDAKRAITKSKTEFLKDVSSFANTSGGHLLYGIKADADAVPVEIIGVSVENKRDDYKRRLEQTLDSQLEPKLLSGSKDIGFIDLQGSKKKVMAIYVAQSVSAPHRVNLNGQFYKRGGSISRPMDVDDLRIAFNLSTNIIKSTKQFKKGRIAELTANETRTQPAYFLSANRKPRYSDSVYGPQRGEVKVVLHLIPLNWFISINSNDLEKARENENMPLMNSRNVVYDLNFEPPRIHCKLNIDGILKYNQIDSRGNTDSFVQLYRCGIIEAVEGGGCIYENRNVDLRLLENQLTTVLPHYLKLLNLLEIDTPIYLFLTLLGFQNARAITANKLGDHIDRNELDIPEVCIKNYDKAPEKALESVFDMLWNACGMKRPEK